MPSPRMPPSPREAPRTVHVALRRRRRACARAQPAGRRGRATARTRRRNATCHAGEAGRRPCSTGSSSSLMSLPARVAAPVQPAAVLGREQRTAPSPAARPASRRAAARAAVESSWWRTVTPLERAQLRPPARRSKPRRCARATASSAATRGRRRRRDSSAVGARASAAVGVRARRRSRSASRRSAAQRVDRLVVPVRRTTRSVGRSVTTSGSTIVSSSARCSGPMSSTTCSRSTPESATRRVLECHHARRASSVVRPVLDRAQDQARGVVAPDARSRLAISPLHSRVDEHDHVEHARRR